MKSCAEKEACQRGLVLLKQTSEVPKSATNLALDVWNENDGRINSLVKLQVEVGIFIDSIPFFMQMKNVINLSSSFYDSQFL